MDAKTKTMIQEWLAMHNGDVEGLARWMRNTIRGLSIGYCRRMIAEAQAA